MDYLQKRLRLCQISNDGKFFGKIVNAYKPSEPITRKCSVKNGVLKNFAKFTGEHLYQRLFFKRDFFEKETLAQVCSCEFCEISKNTFFTEHLWATASVAASEPSTIFAEIFHICFRES